MSKKHFPVLGIVNKASIEELTMPELARLYNQLNPEKPIKKFRTKGDGVEKVWKLGTPAAEAPAPPKAKDEPACVAAHELQRRRARHGYVIRKVAIPGKGQRPRRWDRYQDGMTVGEIIETQGLDARDVNFYVKHGLMKLEKPASAAE